MNIYNARIHEMKYKENECMLVGVEFSMYTLYRNIHAYNTDTKCRFRFGFKFSFSKLTHIRFRFGFRFFILSATALPVYLL
jgi:hypothetical protein